MSDIKLPIRPAPKPPNIEGQKKSIPVEKGCFNNRDPLKEHFKLTRSQSAGKLGEIKKPPPRPPPPKKLVIGSKYQPSNQKKANQLLSGLFGRSKPGNGVAKSQTIANLSDDPSAPSPACGLLIDFNSPPSSPTPTANSGSDGYSVKSFGSSNDIVLNSVNGFSLQTESGFEDDFDSIIASSSTSPCLPDLWADDPFSPSSHLPGIRSTPVLFELSNEDPRCKHKDSSNRVPAVSTKPTIIRAKNSKPERPPPPKARPASTPPTFVSSHDDLDHHPPMPTCPPPPPPPDTIHGPTLPARPDPSLQRSSEKTPCCVALYDYNAGHPDDLSFKANDVIQITGQINEDWLQGTLMGKEGMFPCSFIKIVVPLNTSKQEKCYESKFVIALYTFRAETWDDLPFEEGETVKVTKRINDHWLYGECNGKFGQFPENYVTDVSSILPLQYDFP